MALFWLILISLIAVGEAAGLVFLWAEVNRWAEKYRDAIDDLCPIEWDYTKEDGWRE